MTLSHADHITRTCAKYKHLIPAEKYSPRSSPITASVVSALVAEKPPAADEYDKTRHTNFRSVLGACSHIANFTHPEICFAVSFASQFMANPSEAALIMVLNILLYLLGAAEKVITFTRQSTVPPGSPITVACDADLANSHSNKRSRTGLCAYLYGNLVYACSRLQPSVSLSTAEAEYMAIAAAGRFGAWYKMLVGDIGIVCSYREPAIILSDNLSAIRIAKNPITHKHSRHIDRRLHWLREMTMPQGPVSPTLRILFVPTNLNVSDIMTKACPLPTFRNLRDRLFDGFRFLPSFKPDCNASTSFIFSLQRDDQLLCMMNEL